MKYLIKLICLLLFSGSLLAQQGIADLRARLQSESDDSARVELYKQLIRIFSNENPDSARFYADKGIEYSRAKGFVVGEARIFAQQGIIDRSQGRMNVAEKRLKRALELFKSVDNTRGISDVLGNLGSLEFTKGNADRGAKLTIQSVRLAEKVDNKRGAMVGYMNLGTSYLQQGDFSNAKKYFDKASVVSKQMPMTNEAINLYNIIGIYYAYTGENEKALETFQNNLELSNKHDLVDAHVECLLYLGQYYLEAGDMKKSMSYLELGLEIAEDRKMEEMKADIWQQMAMITLSTNPKRAEEYMNKALEVAKSMENRNSIASIYESQVMMYRSMGQFEKALNATLLRQHIVDSVFSVNKTIELSEIAAEYELEKADAKVNNLERISQRNKTERNIFIGIAVGVLLLLFVLLFYYRRTVELNRELQRHQAELKELNAMKDKLFSVVGHDLRGPIARIPAILDIYEDESTSPEEKQYLLDSLREHTQSSMEMLDKLLFWGQTLVKGITMQAQKVVIDTVVKDNIELRKLSLQEKQISATESVPEDTVVAADPTHVDFIIRNLFANAIKYTNMGGNIEIAAEESSMPGFVVISVKDDGVGIPKEILPMIFNPLKSRPGTADEQGSGIGLMLCKEFAELNGGKMWVESEHRKGATFYLALKKAAAS